MLTIHKWGTSKRSLTQWKWINRQNPLVQLKSTMTNYGDDKSNIKINAKFGYIVYGNDDVINNDQQKFKQNVILCCHAGHYK